ncbi:DNA gyrase inhibitor YacG [Anianabacter salinae]|uniref:DNA gyrase inhibitor YacG n=1 Tax=Anianabacter salinae TaxID=2851023 RepID=UPI00225E0E95|nr:DNA gyrase inhibitor YacG [Anianabacter salinae]MBV0912522.1 DNA gyrase inhibitor YacG [Anianabacter salinae]
MTRCPICKRETHADYRPFCSRRCADVDLGRWVTGAYAIPAEDGGSDGDLDDDGEDTDTNGPRIHH